MSLLSSDSSLPAFLERIVALDAALVVTGDVESEEATAETLALMKPSHRPAALEWVHADALSSCDARRDEIEETIEVMEKQQALRVRFADVAEVHVRFTTELTLLASAYARGESLADAAPLVEVDDAEDAAAKKIDATDVVVITDEEAIAFSSAEGDKDDDDDIAMFEDARAGELRNRLRAVSSLEQRMQIYTDDHFATLKGVHMECEESECSEDNRYTSETITTLQMRWEELQRVVERSRTSITSSLDALRKAGLTTAQIKDVRDTFRSFASAVVLPHEGAEEGGGGGGALESSSTTTTTNNPGEKEGEEGGEEDEEEEVIVTLSVDDFMNAATALGISLPSEAKVVTAVFAEYCADEGRSDADERGEVEEEEEEEERETDVASRRMTLAQFAKFVRQKLGASATKEDVLRALEALAEGEGAEKSPFVTVEAMRGVVGDEDGIGDFVVGVYEEAEITLEGASKEPGTITELDYCRLASVLFAV